MIYLADFMEDLLMSTSFPAYSRSMFVLSLHMCVCVSEVDVVLFGIQTVEVDVSKFTTFLLQRIVPIK